MRRKAKLVGKVTPEIRRLADRMLTEMRAMNGVGLAAPQIGVDKRLFVASVNGKDYLVVDPKVLRQEGAEYDQEGCLSIPGFFGMVRRAMSLEVKFKDRSGFWRTLRVVGFLARVFQHEIDHLTGVLITDHTLHMESN